MQYSGMNRVKGYYFDTVNTITADAPQELLQEAMGLCGDFHALLSRFTPDSDFWRINHSGGQPVAVSPHTLNILRLALGMYAASGGAFNIALGPVLSLWKFRPGGEVPDTGRIREALTLTDCSRISLQDDRVTVPDGYVLDPGGIAKGYITDQAAQFLRVNGVRSALLNFGGNIVTIGDSPDGTPWKIGLQHPNGAQARAFWASVTCKDASVVTSGVYERSFQKDGKVYHHLLDPRTGYPVETNLLAVSARAESSILADACTTAMFVLGKEAGLSLASRCGVDAVFLDNTGSVRYSNSLDITFLSGQQ